MNERSKYIWVKSGQVILIILRGKRTQVNIYLSWSWIERDCVGTLW